MTNEVSIIGLEGIPFIKPGDNIPNIILEALNRNNLILENGDILVIAQSIISKSTDRIRNLKEIIPNKETL